jgi:hypothetical protein
MKLSYLVDLLQEILYDEGNVNVAVITQEETWETFLCDPSFKIDMVAVPDESGIEYKYLGLLSGSLFRNDKEMGKPNLKLLE